MEEERRRAQTTIKETRNERDESRQLAETLHRANEGFRRTVLNLERQAAGAPGSWGEERQTLTTESDDAIARTRTLRRELDASIAERRTMEERIVELTREMRRSRRIRLDMTNSVNTERRRREITEVNNGLVREERNTARADLTRTTERDDARALLEQRTQELEAITIEPENLQNRLTDVETTLTQRETEIQTRTTERNNARNEVRQVRTELETLTTDLNNQRNGRGTNNGRNEEVIQLTARLDEVRRTVDLYMDRYATCRQDVGRLQGQLERANEELREARRG